MIPNVCRNAHSDPKVASNVCVSRIVGCAGMEYIVSSYSIWDDGCGAIKINRQCNFFFPILVCSFASNLSDLLTISWRIPLLVISMMLVSGCFMESIHCFRWICDDGYAAMECYFDYMVWTMLLQCGAPVSNVFNGD